MVGVFWCVYFVVYYVDCFDLLDFYIGMGSICGYWIVFVGCGYFVVFDLVVVVYFVLKFVIF